MKRDAALWAGVLTGPIVWFVSFVANFQLAWWVCASRWKPAAYGVSVSAMLVTSAAGWLSWHQWQHVDAEDGRSRALAMSGVMLNAGFLVVLIAEALPQILMNGCE